MVRISSENILPKKRAKELIRSAKRALKHAYTPYSGISVAAVLYCANGHVYTGCNIENGSYSLTMCAERVALFKARSEGEKNFKVLLLYSPQIDSVVPCGACLQVYSELAPDILIVTMNNRNEFRFYPLKTLLPKPFSVSGRSHQ